MGNWIPYHATILDAIASLDLGYGSQSVSQSVIIKPFSGCNHCNMLSYLLHLWSYLIFKRGYSLINWLKKWFLTTFFWLSLQQKIMSLYLILQITFEICDIIFLFLHLSKLAQIWHGMARKASIIVWQYVLLSDLADNRILRIIDWKTFNLSQCLKPEWVTGFWEIFCLEKVNQKHTRMDIVLNP